MSDKINYRELLEKNANYLVKMAPSRNIHEIKSRIQQLFLLALNIEADEYIEAYEDILVLSNEEKDALLKFTSMMLNSEKMWYGISEYRPVGEVDITQVLPVLQKISNIIRSESKPRETEN